MLYIANPNNPVGYALDVECLQRIEALCRRLSSILVIDEAYYEFCGISIASRVQDPESPLIVMRTFSKAFGLAGLRIGYLLAPPGVMSSLRRVHNPKSVTTLAKAAALAALGDRDAVEAYVGEVKRGRDRVLEALRRAGARAYPSAGNYILFEWPHAKELAGYLEDRGILVRDRTEQLGRPSVRVTIGSARTVDRLLRALDGYFAELGERRSAVGGEAR
jgi:histidinol-phosphate aminotransferase